jgi:hypothetical protein
LQNVTAIPYAHPVPTSLNVRHLDAAGEVKP